MTSPRMSAPKADALPGCATPRHAEPLSFCPVESASGNAFHDIKRQNKARTGNKSPGIVPDYVAVLFLDIDGVVLSGQELWRTHNNRYLPPEKIALVKEVCDRTGAVIVVSSTWRYSDETRDVLLHAGLPLHTDWRTDWRNDYVGSIIIGQRRGLEIFRWLAKHPEVNNYAIVDDDSDMLPEQRPHFVQTPFETGIGQDHVEALVGRLTINAERTRNG